MTNSARDWARWTEAYRLQEQKELALYHGQKTFSDRIGYSLLRLKNQFLSHYGGAVPRWRIRLRSFGGERTLPDFACIGAMKSGTTDLALYLFQHPCILPPLSKEIQPINPAAWRPYYPTVREKALVKEQHGHALCGYFNPVLNSLAHMDSIRAARPDAKIILMLRNPIDRAYSQYKWEMLYGGKRRAQSPYYKTFADHVNVAIDLFPAITLPSRFGPLLQPGIYVKSVELWIERFGRENIYVVRSEDFFKDIPSVVCSIHEFLGIPPIKPETHAVVNQNPMKPLPFEEETRRKLQAFYRPWNEKLYALLDRDMGWD